MKARGACVSICSALSLNNFHYVFTKKYVRNTASTVFSTQPFRLDWPFCHRNDLMLMVATV